MKKKNSNCYLKHFVGYYFIKYHLKICLIDCYSQRDRKENLTLEMKEV